MAVEETNTSSISKNNTGFPDYLDFEKLRRESIEYISQLSGKIWTDHNVHDPGITILEVLCYALIDLGYRTHLPIEDILAQNPKDTSEDNNFFTAAEILTCNPLTIVDYRKLLIDIEGVRNAWLFPADEKDSCKQDTASGLNTNELFLNGIYRVQIELEKYPGTDTVISVQEFAKPILENVKSALMGHRNFCEDFLDIHVLCRYEMGVCASIELEDQADPEIVYVDMVQVLTDFFSPAPRFYTLKQMLDKQLSMDEIYAGRPYDKTESHGFIDTAELEAIELRKEIHVSDVYTALFQVKGIKKISSLRLINCEKSNTSLGNWKVSIPKNHVPVFAVRCSGFEFIRNGLKVNVDTQKFETLFELGFNNNNKTAYPYSSSYLNPELPKGHYEESLGDYYSIQNEFPQVYGIGNGDLPENVSSLRKAQALQLKGYLLFFDQLLANYLSQLQHIRHYFSLSAPKNKTDRHTYFLNQLRTVPEIDKLLRFSSGNSALLGKDGDTLAFPISSSRWEQLKLFTGNLQDHINSLPSYDFASMGDASDAIEVLQNDLITAKDVHIYTFHTSEDSWCYAISATDQDYVLLCKRLFETEQAAKQHASSLQYTAIHHDNYRHFITQHNKFSFEVEFNITSYTGYLELLIENETIYRQRRKDFLNHLLARFAEKFTEFALLTWQDDQSIPVVENFLTDYDNLSRNRGRAYNYQSDSWNFNNQSGFEKKVKALAGLPQQTTTLCHFIVEPCEEHFTVTIRNGKNTLFTSKEKFDSRAEAELAAQAIIQAMSNPVSYHTHYLAHEKSYQLQLHYGHTQPATHPVLFRNSQHADQLAYHLLSSVNPQPEKESVFVSEYIWKSELRNAKKELLATSLATYHTAEQANSESIKLVKKLNDKKVWETHTGKTIPVLHIEKINETELILIDFHAFKIDINDTIIGKPGKYTYDLLDHNNSFKLSPKNTFDSSKAAREHAHSMLIAALDFNNWKIEHHSKNGRYSIQLVSKGIPEASFITDTTAYTETEELLLFIYKLITEQTYHLTESEHPNQWKFHFSLGYEEDAIFRFISDPEYHSEKDAHIALANFYKGMETLQLKSGPGRLTLTTVATAPTVSLLVDERQIPGFREKITGLLEDQKQLFEIFRNASQKKLSAYVKSDRQSEQEEYIYRLVNNNHIPAHSLLPIPTPGDQQLYKRKLAAAYKQQQWFPAICQGGDLLKKHIDRSGTVRFHFEIRFRSLPFSGCEETVMLTSAPGFLTEEEAEQAFQESYLRILNMASDKEAYGKRISLTPVYLPHAGTPSTDVLAFIPEETIALFQQHFKTNWLDTFIHFIAFYPVKTIKKDSRRFAELFCSTAETIDFPCSTNRNGEWVYYFDFSLLNPPADLADAKWVSTDYFEAPETALQEFLYFNRLLSFPGNWFFDSDYCSFTKTSGYYFFIREVLAESTICFPSEEAAWGPQGVEAFICAAQSSKGIRNYLRKTDCSYSFYISCGENAVIHPCTYDTTSSRDEAINELYSRFKRLSETKAYALTYEGNNLIIHNGEGIPVAKWRDIKTNSACEAGISIAGAIQSSGSSWQADQGVYILKSTDNRVVLESMEKSTVSSLESWKNVLEEWACFFPIVKTEAGTRVITDATGKKNIITLYKYCIEIKLPGFGNCGKDKLPDTPCNCKKQTPLTGSCYIAWKSNCCFETCEEAFRALELTLRLLSDFKNYYPVFDCHSNSFGITLHEVATTIQESADTGKLLARNPQYYQTPDQACQAAEDAKQLVNAGGLHVVEHILLRPHCPEDCGCDQRMQYCDPYGDCHFPPYLISSPDPCVKDQELSFLPGTDPYSFIATVILPSWPSMLRDKDKKQQAEHILYNEAPAHVLLRILWLRPKDFYAFEKQFRKWKKWLAGIPFSTNDFSVCNFLDLVTKESFSCLPECSICKPCSGVIERKETPCTEYRRLRSDAKDADFLNQVNTIFCMGNFYCGDKTGESTHLPGKEKHTTEGKAFSETVTIKAKAQFINSRHNQYLQAANSISGITQENPVVTKTTAFIQNNHPGIEQLESLVKEVLKNKKPARKNSKPLTKQQIQKLVYITVHHYLDKVVFNGKETGKITALTPLVNLLKKAKVNLSELHQSWGPQQVLEYEPDFDTTLIKKIMTEK